MSILNIARAATDPTIPFPRVPDFGTIEHKWDIAGEGHMFADRDHVSHILLLGAFDDGDDAASLCGDVFQGGDLLPQHDLCDRCHAIWEKGEL